MKDIDFKYLKQPKKLIQMNDDEKSHVVENIHNDVKFLMNNGFMDYSLLLTIRQLGARNSVNTYKNKVLNLNEKLIDFDESFG